jgi:serine phosphatase RsbU (regulator of sigma subunit)
MKRRERKLQRDKKHLEHKVAERTAEIRKQKEQIEHKNKEITDSLNYASQIQSAILPPIEILKEMVSAYFVINKPKDIVSGDFYWFSEVGEKLIITAADCTGHGVPGAFLSLLGVTFLNEITNKVGPLYTNVILDQLRERVISSLNQQSFNKKRYDGIDLSMAIIDFETMELQFAGANNPIYIVRNGHLTEIKGNRMPIGVQSAKPEPFTNHIIEIKKGDKIYMFSDGFTDQFGGELGRKFLSRNFKLLLEKIFRLKMYEQEKILLETFDLWKGKYEQIDDVLIIGIKI